MRVRENRGCQESSLEFLEAFDHGGGDLKRLLLFQFGGLSYYISPWCSNGGVSLDEAAVIPCLPKEGSGLSLGLG